MKIFTVIFDGQFVVNFTQIFDWRVPVFVCPIFSTSVSVNFTSNCGLLLEVTVSNCAWCNVDKKRWNENVFRHVVSPCELDMHRQYGQQNRVHVHTNVSTPYTDRPLKLLLPNMTFRTSCSPSRPCSERTSGVFTIAKRGKDTCDYSVFMDLPKTHVRTCGPFVEENS